MIINFVGLPASGKTTTVRLLENKGLVKRIAFRNKLEIFFLVYTRIFAFSTNFYQRLCHGHKIQTREICTMELLYR